MYRTYDNVKFSEKDSNESGRPIWLAGSALGDRCHVCAFFNNREEEDRVLLPFVQDGLERGEKIVHTIDPEQRGEHLERLAAGGIDVAPLLQNGRLELRTWSDTHLLDGYFDQRRTLKLFEGVEKNAKRQGFPLTRFVTHMEWALKNEKQITDLLEYEARANEVWERQDGPLNPIICTYDLTKFTGDVVDCARRSNGGCRQVIAAIGPLWSWHEVWLVGTGGVTVMALPRLMAASFSGCYLALFLILWCVLLRGISIEVGGHLSDRLWQAFWDAVFVFSNVLLAVLFGSALGNVARGVPLTAEGTFYLPFFTNFGIQGNVGLLDWYTVPMALFCALILTAHGATYLTMKTEGAADCAAPDASLIIGTVWWFPALILALGYLYIIQRHYSGKVNVPKDNQGFY
jgi:hypothetical protein